MFSHDIFLTLYDLLLPLILRIRCESATKHSAGQPRAWEA